MGIKLKIFEIRKEVGKLSKDTNNPFYKSKYADINQLIELTDPLFAKHNILAVQPVRNGCLITELTDLDSGETMESVLELPQSNDPQKIGSAITYYRRYSLKSLLNIQEEDDDGNKGSEKSSPEPKGDASDERPWLSEANFNKILARINKGEKLFDQTDKAYKMKKNYSTTLKSAEQNYKPKT